MDFLEQLTKRINVIPGLPVNLRMGYLDIDESFAIYPIPGGRVVNQFYDGTTDQQLNYELTMKSKSQQKVHDTLWSVQNELEVLSQLESEDGSFEFNDLAITNKPFVDQLDEQGWFVFSLNIQANITIYKKEIN